jgi:predicted PurR-regulated permease PerM
MGISTIFGFIQFIEGNFITPKITGSKVSLNSFASILAIIFDVMGIPGMILALPNSIIESTFDNTENLNLLDLF